MSTAAFDLGTTPSTPPGAPTAAEKVQLQKAIGIDATGYSDTTVTFAPTFSGSFVQEGTYTPPTGWRDMIIVTQIGLSSTSADAVNAALQIKTTSAPYLVPWAIPLATTDGETVDARQTVIRLQRAKDAVFLNTYMSNGSYTNETFLSEMNVIVPPESLDTYFLGNGGGGGTGGTGGGTGTGVGSIPLDQLVGMNLNAPYYIRADGRAISACIVPASLTASYLLRLNLTQLATAYSISVRILAL